MSARGERSTLGPELRVALVGCGAVARDVHLPVLDELAGVAIAGLCDLDRERAQDLASRFGVPSFDDFSALLKTLEPDVVHVLTRPESHAELALQALEAGCHVLVEKPFVYTLREAERVFERARLRQRRVSVVHNYLEHPSVTELLGRVRAGELGAVCSVHFLHGRRDQSYVPDPWYFRTRGGRLGETLPHALYLLAAFVDGLELRHVEAQRLGRVQLPAHTQPQGAGYDELRVELCGRGGVGATITYSLNASLPQSLIVAGTDATLQALIGPEPRVMRWSGRAPDGAELARLASRWLSARLGRARRSQHSPLESPHGRQIRAFLASLRSGAEPPVSEQSALEVVRLWEAVVGRYAGASTGA